MQIINTTVTPNFNEDLSLLPQRIWDIFIINVCMNDALVASIIAMFVVPFIIIYWLLGGVITLFDILKKPVALRDHKIQNPVKNEVTFKDAISIICYVAMNQILVGLPATFGMHYLIVWRGYEFKLLPSFKSFFFQNVAFLLLDDFSFYYIHRFILHNRHLYKYVHKLHHKFTAPFALTAFYLHPLEYLYSASLNYFGWPFLFGSHLFTIMFRFSLLAILEIYAHSGFKVSFLPPALTPEAHDYHHMNFLEMYGILGIMDYIHGTDKKFSQTEIYKDHLFWKFNPFNIFKKDKKQFVKAPTRDNVQVSMITV